MDNGEVLLNSYQKSSKAIRGDALLTPAAEWLVGHLMGTASLGTGDADDS